MVLLKMAYVKEFGLKIFCTFIIITLTLCIAFAKLTDLSFCNLHTSLTQICSSFNIEHNFLSNTNRFKRIDTLEWLKRNYSVYGDNTCEDNTKRKIFLKLMKKWMEIAKRENITYFIITGTLLGAWRNEDVIPYDQDLDVIIDGNNNENLEKLKDERGFNPSDDKLHLILQKDWRLPYDKRRRFRCDGEKVKSYAGHCSFQEPLGRLITEDTHLDIYDYTTENDKLLDPSEWKKEYFKKDIFPLKKCMFMGLVTVCPKKPLVILEAFYGKILSPLKICKNGKWIKI